MRTRDAPEPHGKHEELLLAETQQVDPVALHVQSSRPRGNALDAEVAKEVLAAAAVHRQ